MGFQDFLPLALNHATMSPLVEVRALWVTRWDYSSSTDVIAIVDHAADAGFNVIFFQVRGNADAFYESSYEPWAQRLTGTLGQDPGWDPLAVAISRAHELGLQLHAYINVYPAWVGTSPPPLANPEPMVLEFDRLYGDTWVQWDDSGPMDLNASYLWASPGHSAVADHIVEVAFDLISRYDVDGLHLDYVRYAGPSYSQDPESLSRYQIELIANPDLTWNEWQRSQITSLVSRIHDDLTSWGPALELSAAVWPVYRSRWPWWTGADGYDGYFQDSQGWLQAEHIDSTCPMLYGSTISPDEDRFQVLLQDHVDQAGSGSVYAGISADYDDFTSVADRIALARTVGAHGQAIFSARLVDQRGYWDDFAQGPYAQPAVVP